MEKQIIGVGGMNCASCSGKVEQTVGKLAGVHMASVNLAAEQLSVEFEPAVISVEAIKETVTTLGFQVLEKKKTVKSRFRLLG